MTNLIKSIYHKWRYGGFYIGNFTYPNGETYKIIVSPKKYEFFERWFDSFRNLPVTNDGYLNCLMANSRNDSPIIENLNKINKGRFDDWFVPSLKEFLFIFKNKEKLPVDDRFDRIYYWASTMTKSISIDHFWSGRAVRATVDWNSVTLFDVRQDNKWQVRPIRKIKI